MREQRERSHRPWPLTIKTLSRMKGFIEKIKGKPYITEGTSFGILFAMGFCHLLNDMVQSVVPALYPLLKDNFGFTFAQIGIITLVYQLTSSIFQPFVGLYADTHPKPYSLAAGMCFTLAGLLTLAYASGFLTILAAVSIIGCGSAIFHPEASRVVQLGSGGKKSLAQAIFQVGGNGGSALGPLLAALIVLPYGQHAVGWLALAAMLASFILVRVGAWYSLFLAKKKEHKTNARTVSTGLPARTVHAALAILVLMLFSKYFFNACMTSYFTFYLIDKFEVPVGQSQICLFAYLAAFALGTLAGGFLGDRYGRKYIILFSILGAAPFTLAMPYMNLGWTIFMAVMSGFVIASAFSAILVYATDLMPDKLGMISGMFFGMMFGLGGIGSAFFGWLADLTSIEYIFHISTLLPLLGIIAVFLPDIRPDRKR